MKKPIRPYKPIAPARIDFVTSKPIVKRKIEIQDSAKFNTRFPANLMQEELSALKE